MEKYFPHCGKNSPIFPHYGKYFRDFSTLWKECFHGVENSVLRLFSGVFGCSPGAVERSPRRPLSIVARDRPRGRKKRRPTQAGSVLSRNRLGCGVGSGRFFWPRGRGISRALRCEGALRASDDLLRGLLKISEDWETIPRKAEGLTPVPNALSAVGTVPGAVQSPRLAG